MNDQTGGIWRIMGIGWPLFAGVAVLVLAACYAGTALPGGMVGAIPLMMVLGAVFNEIGNRTPLIKDYLGGGPIVIIFASAALATSFARSATSQAAPLLPATSVEIVKRFMTDQGFLDFYIAALITGSLFGMSRSLLIRAARTIPAGDCRRIGGRAGPQCRGRFADRLRRETGGRGRGHADYGRWDGRWRRADVENLQRRLSSRPDNRALENGSRRGDGQCAGHRRSGNAQQARQGGPLVDRKRRPAAQTSASETFERAATLPDVEELGIGLLLATAFFVWGEVLAKVIDVLGWAERLSLHPYALMILSVALVKVLGLLPRRYEQAAAQWFRFVMICLTPALLVGIGIAYTDLNEVAAAFSVQYLVLVTAAVLGAVVGSGMVGYLCGFYPIESAITAGLCMANMGGTGDVAVLSASDRIVLMPFAQISSRIGGAFVLILASALLHWLG